MSSCYVTSTRSQNRLAHQRKDHGSCASAAQENEEMKHFAVNSTFLYSPTYFPRLQLIWASRTEDSCVGIVICGQFCKANPALATSLCRWFPPSFHCVINSAESFAVLWLEKEREKSTASWFSPLITQRSTLVAETISVFSQWPTCLLAHPSSSTLFRAVTFLRKLESN